MSTAVFTSSEYYETAPHVSPRKREWQAIDEMGIPGHIGSGLYNVWRLIEKHLLSNVYRCFDVGHGDIAAKLEKCLQDDRLKGQQVHIAYVEINESEENLQGLVKSIISQLRSGHEGLRAECHDT